LRVRKRRFTVKLCNGGEAAVCLRVPEDDSGLTEYLKWVGACEGLFVRVVLIFFLPPA